MTFDWDQHNREHIAQHDVSPAEVEQALADPDALVVSATSTSGEPRAGAIAATLAGRVLVVIWTSRDGRIRPITARDASRKERRQYASEA